MGDAWTVSVLGMDQGSITNCNRTFHRFLGYEVLVNEGRAGLFLGHIVTP